MSGQEPIAVCSSEDLNATPYAVVTLDRGDVCAIEDPGRPGREVLLCLEATFEKDILEAISELSMRPARQGAYRPEQIAFRGDAKKFVALARKILAHFEGDT